MERGSCFFECRIGGVVYIWVMGGVWAMESDGLTGDASFSAGLVVEIV